MMPVQLSEDTVGRCFPYPIAAAWHRVTVSADENQRSQRLVLCNEILLRTLAALLLPDYLRGPKSPVVEPLIRKLQRPTDGIWCDLVRELIRWIGERGDPAPFIPEAQQWYYSRDRKPTAAAQLIDQMVAVRNDIVHRPSNPVETRNRMDKLESGIRSTLLGMTWLVGYRPFRVLKIEPTKRRTLKGLLQFLVGTEEQTKPIPAEWDIFLGKNYAYLSNPKGDALLELAPFLEVLEDKVTGEDHLFLIKEVPDLKEMTRVRDWTNSQDTDTDLLELDDRRVSFEEWLQHRESQDFYRPLRKSIDVLPPPGKDPVPVSKIDLGRRYEIISELGQGGMAVVYLVRDRKWNEEAALKVLNADEFEDETSRERFKREALNMNKIHHPCIVRVMEIGDLPDGRPYLKMPAMLKGNLSQQIAPRKGRSEELVRGWADNALEALQCVHAAGIVHRDVKPSNFLLADDGRAMLTDFGIALNADDDRLTRTLGTVGTIQYMAPEQRMLRTVTGKADIYGLAIVLHELLTGELPAGNPGEGLGGDFGGLIRWMGKTDPQDRPEAKEALQKLRAPITQPEPLPPPARDRQTQSAMPRVKRLALAIFATLFVINFMETWIETKVNWGAKWERALGDTALSMERDFRFTFDEFPAQSPFTDIAFSIVYFFVFPALGLTALVIFFRRREGNALLLLATATAVNYAITLPFYILFPVAERWAYPETGAILLSDRVNSNLMGILRPVSGLNNCFPSFHVSMVVVIVICFFRERIPFRSVSIPIGLAIILSTFALGIHWVADIVTGIAAGIISVWVAERVLRRRQSKLEALLLRPAVSLGAR